MKQVTKKLAPLLILLFSLSMHSCSKGYGCYFTTTEIQEITTHHSTQERDEGLKLLKPEALQFESCSSVQPCD